MCGRVIVITFGYNVRWAPAIQEIAFVFSRSACTCSGPGRNCGVRSYDAERSVQLSRESSIAQVAGLAPRNAKLNARPGHQGAAKVLAKGER